MSTLIGAGLNGAPAQTTWPLTWPQPSAWTGAGLPTSQNDPKQTAKLFKGIDKGEVKGKFEEAVQQGPFQCARIGMEINLQGQPEGVPVPMVFKGTGKGFFATDIRHSLDMELTGPITMKGEVKQNGVTIHFAGEGTLAQKETRRWMKLAGKPAPQK